MCARSSAEVINAEEERDGQLLPISFAFVASCEGLPAAKDEAEAEAEAETGDGVIARLSNCLASRHKQLDDRVPLYSSCRRSTGERQGEKPSGSLVKMSEENTQGCGYELLNPSTSRNGVEE